MSEEDRTDTTRQAVEAVVVNWNAGEYLTRCVESLLENHPRLDLSVTVVDNASTDGSIRALEGRERVRLILNTSNRGFAAAVNHGLAGLRPETGWVLVLNPDSEFTGDVLSPLLDFLNTHPDAGVVTASIEGPAGSFQATCRRREPSPAGMLFHLTGLSHLFPGSRLFAGYIYGDSDPGTAHRVEAVSGSFMLMRREVLEQAGGFDERYFMYAEDLEFCRRVRRAGWTIWYQPVAGVVHHGAVSSGKARVKSLWHKHYTACQYLNSARRNDMPVLLRWTLSLVVMLLLVPRVLLALVSVGRGR